MLHLILSVFYTTFIKEKSRRKHQEADNNVHHLIYVEGKQEKLRGKQEKLRGKQEKLRGKQENMILRKKDIYNINKNLFIYNLSFL